MRHNLGVRRIITACAFLLLLLPGCISVSTSPPPHFYSLQSIKEGGSALSTDDSGLGNAIVGIGPLTLPEYFDRPHIVTENRDNTIEFAQFDRWAEPLNEAMTRIIAQNCSILLPKLNIEIFPWNSAIPVTYQVIMKAIRLDLRLEGEAAMLLQWSILDARKKMLLTRRSEFRAPVEAHDYASLVQAMSVICESVSKVIAQALIDLPKQGQAVKN